MIVIGRRLTPTNVYAYKNMDYNIFIREFENAIVAVNPYGTATGVISLDATYNLLSKKQNIRVKKITGRIEVAIGENNQLQLDSVTSVQLEGYSAVILMLLY